LAGYAVVIVFGTTYLLARLPLIGLSATEALLAAGLLAAPLALAVVGERITGLRFGFFEVSLTDVSAHIAEDLSTAIKELADMGPSVMPSLSERIVRSIEYPGVDLVLRVNLGDGTNWWSTRIFLLAALADDYTDIRQLVFVHGGERRIFVGLAAPAAIHRSLRQAFPLYEGAYRSLRAELVGYAPPPIAVAPTPPVNRGDEVQQILERWPERLQWNEAAIKEFATPATLKQWLLGAICTESVDWDGGPLTPLLRFQINSRRDPFVALTTKGQLAAVVDRVSLATRTTADTLRARLS